ncbi:hypothetical protein ABKV19_009625 [Rosa sericea]
MGNGWCLLTGRICCAALRRRGRSTISGSLPLVLSLRNPQGLQYVGLFIAFTSDKIGLG